MPHYIIYLVSTPLPPSSDHQTTTRPNNNQLTGSDKSPTPSSSLPSQLLPLSTSSSNNQKQTAELSKRELVAFIECQQFVLNPVVQDDNPSSSSSNSRRIQIKSPYLSDFSSNSTSDDNNFSANNDPDCGGDTINNINTSSNRQIETETNRNDRHQLEQQQQQTDRIDTNEPKLLKQIEIVQLSSNAVLPSTSKTTTRTTGNASQIFIQPNLEHVCFYGPSNNTSNNNNNDISNRNDGSHRRSGGGGGYSANFHNNLNVNVIGQNSSEPNEFVDLYFNCGNDRCRVIGNRSTSKLLLAGILKMLDHHCLGFSEMIYSLNRVSNESNNIIQFDLNQIIDLLKSGQVEPIQDWRQFASLFLKIFLKTDQYISRANHYYYSKRSLETIDATNIESLKSQLSRKQQSMSSNQSIFSSNRTINFGSLSLNCCSTAATSYNKNKSHPLAASPCFKPSKLSTSMADKSNNTSNPNGSQSMQSKNNTNNEKSNQNSGKPTEQGKSDESKGKNKVEEKKNVMQKFTQKMVFIFYYIDTKGGDSQDGKQKKKVAFGYSSEEDGSNSFLQNNILEFEHPNPEQGFIPQFHTNFCSTVPPKVEMQSIDSGRLTEALKADIDSVAKSPDRITIYLGARAILKVVGQKGVGASLTGYHAKITMKGRLVIQAHKGKIITMMKETTYDRMIGGKVDVFVIEGYVTVAIFGNDMIALIYDYPAQLKCKRNNADFKLTQNQLAPKEGDVIRSSSQPRPKAKDQVKFQAKEKDQTKEQPMTKGQEKYQAKAQQDSAKEQSLAIYETKGSRKEADNNTKEAKIKYSAEISSWVKTVTLNLSKASLFEKEPAKDVHLPESVAIQKMDSKDIEIKVYEEKGQYQTKNQHQDNEQGQYQAKEQDQYQTKDQYQAKGSYQAKEQDQNQAKEQGQYQTKDQYQEKDQYQAKEQGQYQAKEQGQYQAKDQYQAKEQDQYQTKEQGQYQAKEQGQYQAKEQGQYQAKEQGQYQAKEQGQYQAKEQGQYQAKDQYQAKEQDQYQTKEQEPYQNKEQGQYQVNNQGKYQAKEQGQFSGKETAKEQSVTEYETKGSQKEIETNGKEAQVSYFMKISSWVTNITKSISNPSLVEKKSATKEEKPKSPQTMPKDGSSAKEQEKYQAKNQEQDTGKVPNSEKETTKSPPEDELRLHRSTSHLSLLNILNPEESPVKTSSPVKKVEQTQSEDKKQPPATKESMGYKSKSTSKSSLAYKATVVADNENERNDQEPDRYSKSESNIMKELHIYREPSTDSFLENPFLPPKSPSKQKGCKSVAYEYKALPGGLTEAKKNDDQETEIGKGNNKSSECQNYKSMPAVLTSHEAITTNKSDPTMSESKPAVLTSAADNDQPTTKTTVVKQLDHLEESFISTDGPQSMSVYLEHTSQSIRYKAIRANESLPLAEHNYKALPTGLTWSPSDQECKSTLSIGKVSRMPPASDQPDELESGQSSSQLQLATSSGRLDQIRDDQDAKTAQQPDMKNETDGGSNCNKNENKQQQPKTADGKDNEKQTVCAMFDTGVRVPDIDIYETKKSTQKKQQEPVNEYEEKQLQSELNFNWAKSVSQSLSKTTFPRDKLDESPIHLPELTLKRKCPEINFEEEKAKAKKAAEEEAKAKKAAEEEAQAKKAMEEEAQAKKAMEEEIALFKEMVRGRYLLGRSVRKQSGEKHAAQTHDAEENEPDAEQPPVDPRTTARTGEQIFAGQIAASSYVIFHQASKRESANNAIAIFDGQIGWTPDRPFPEPSRLSSGRLDIRIKSSANAKQYKQLELNKDLVTFVAAESGVIRVYGEAGSAFAFTTNGKLSISGRLIIIYDITKPPWLDTANKSKNNNNNKGNNNNNQISQNNNSNNKNQNNNNQNNQKSNNKTLSVVGGRCTVQVLSGKLTVYICANNYVAIVDNLINNYQIRRDNIVYPSS